MYHRLVLFGSLQSLRDPLKITRESFIYLRENVQEFGKHSTWLSSRQNTISFLDCQVNSNEIVPGSQNSFKIFSPTYLVFSMPRGRPFHVSNFSTSPIELCRQLNHFLQSYVSKYFSLWCKSNVVSTIIQSAESIRLFSQAFRLLSFCSRGTSSW